MALRVGETRRARILGSEAYYRVMTEPHSSLGTLEVEVISGPGLTPGLRVRLTAEAVEAMELVA